MSADIRDLGRRLVGRWTCQGTHPALPGTVVHGSAEIDWLEGERFLIWRARVDHPDFPDSISILGDMGGLRWHYYDSRGVYRVMELTVTEDGLQTMMSRSSSERAYASPDAAFSQRMTFTLEDADQKLSGKGQLSRDDLTWQDDLEITYHRAR